MLLSLNWLSDYIKLKKTPEQIAERLTMSSIEVESVTREAEGFRNIVTGKVLACGKHPQADRLKVCRVSTGKEERTIVCGAPNVAAGQKVAVALPGAVVTSMKTGERVEIKATVLRGVESQGMICGEDELGLSGPSAGIMVLPDATPVGVGIAEYIGKTDVVIELAVLAHRGDCMGHLGVAREVAALFDVRLAERKYALPKASGKKKLHVTVEDGDLCGRYSGLIISGIDAKMQSPQWLQDRLVKVGERPINFVVDLTNYIMHDLGQPLHAFDYDQLRGQQITIRGSRDGEKIAVIGGGEYALPVGSIVIEDSERLVDLAGIKGAAVSSFSDKTTTLFLEAAAMQGVAIRRTSRRIGLRSEAVGYFEKGVDAQVLMNVLSKAFVVLKQHMPSVQLEGIVDVRKKIPAASKVKFRPERVAQLGGVNVPSTIAQNALTRLGFVIKKKSKSEWVISVPSWRRDVSMEEDLVEEVVRIIGYEKIPATLPIANIRAAAPDPQLRWQRRIKQLLADQGGFEVINFSFLSPQRLREIGQEAKDHVKVQNPLSEDQQYLRSELVSGLLNVARTNSQRGEGQVFFEFGRVFFPGSPDVVEKNQLTMCVVGEGAFLRAKGFAENVLEAMGVQASSTVLVRPDNWRECAYWNMFAEGQAADFREANVHLGVVSMVDPKVLKNFDLQKPVAFCTLYVDALVERARTVRQYAAFSRFPIIELDVAAFVPQRVTWAEIEKSVEDLREPIMQEVHLLDVYVGRGVPEGQRSIAFRVTFQSPDRTLRAEEADVVLAKVWKQLEQRFGAQIRK